MCVFLCVRMREREGRGLRCKARGTARASRRQRKKEKKKEKKKKRRRKRGEAHHAVGHDHDGGGLVGHNVQRQAPLHETTPHTHVSAAPMTGRASTWHSCLGQRQLRT
eukprot:3102811-Rhodomonas_salina.1